MQQQDHIELDTVASMSEIQSDERKPVYKENQKYRIDGSREAKTSDSRALLQKPGGVPLLSGYISISFARYSRE